jgi:CheY-like chemotaxis protein
VKVLPAVLGAGAGAAVVLSGAGVADAHARLTLSGAGLFLEDLGTGEITRVNDLSARRVHLQNGDIVELGEVKLLAQLVIPAGLALVEARTDGFSRRRKGISLWVAGFSPQVRKWFLEEMSRNPRLEPRVFNNGEEVLAAVSEALGQDRIPATIILDLHLPIINGINVAVATRGFELGFNRLDHIPLVFLFNPPESSNFDKVVNFCQPVRVLAPGENDDTLKRRLEEITAAVLAGT